jgi:hypothetical protein
MVGRRSTVYFPRHYSGPENAEPPMLEEAFLSHGQPVTDEVAPAEPSVNAQRRLAGQRAKFTMYLRQYQATEDPGFAASAAGYLRWAKNNGFTIAGFTKSDGVPEAILRLVDDGPEGEVTVDEAVRANESAVDTSDVLRLGEGPEYVYGYGYAVAPGCIKVGSIKKMSPIERIARQIETSTPGRPVLLIAIATANSQALARALHGILECRGRKITGGGEEWFRAHRDEIASLVEFVLADTTDPRFSDQDSSRKPAPEPATGVGLYPGGEVSGEVGNGTGAEWRAAAGDGDRGERIVVDAGRQLRHGRLPWLSAPASRRQNQGSSPVPVAPIGDAVNSQGCGPDPAQV